jgi:hypothetical protein
MVELRISLTDIVVIVLILIFLYAGYLIWKRIQELVRPVTYEEAVTSVKAIGSGTMYYWGIT